MSGRIRIDPRSEACPPMGARTSLSNQLNNEDCQPHALCSCPILMSKPTSEVPVTLMPTASRLSTCARASDAENAAITTNNAVRKLYTLGAAPEQAPFVQAERR